jgi:hypothetical protein
MKQNERSVFSLDPLHKFGSNYTKKLSLKMLCPNVFQNGFNSTVKVAPQEKPNPSLFRG